MKIIDNTFENYVPLYPIEEFCPRDKALYIDIETTGLSKEHSSLYLIGCGYYKNNNFYTKLFFADSPDEELDILNLYIDFAESFTHLIHFNGTKFDIPYLEYKAKKYSIDGIFKDITMIDVYVMSKPLRQLLFPVSMRQKYIEDFLNIERKDKYNGGELIEVYKNYCKTKDDELFDALITHNLEDVLGMHKIMPILHFLKLIGSNPLRYISHTVNEYEDYNNITKKELFITYESLIPIPKDFSARTDTLYLKAYSDNNTFNFRLPIITGEMKMFFDNYRDYIYHKELDTCIHKSVAMGLDKKKYCKATKDTCYQKITGDFIKQPAKIFSPSLKLIYKDKCSYFKYPDSFELDKADEFGNELLKVFFRRK